MVFTGSSTFTFSNLTLSGLKGIERRCAECGKAFDEGDAVVVLATGQYHPDDSVPLDDAISIVHIKGKEQGSCLEEFLPRYLTGLENRAKQATKSIPVVPADPGLESSPT